MPAKPMVPKKPGPSPIPDPNKPEFPMRVNKFLAAQGHGSRRDIDRMITQGQIFINGKRAVLGDKVMESDVVTSKFRRRMSKAEREEIKNQPKAPRGY